MKQVKLTIDINANTDSLLLKQPNSSPSKCPYRVFNLITTCPHFHIDLQTRQCRALSYCQFWHFLIKLLCASTILYYRHSINTSGSHSRAIKMHYPWEVSAAAQTPNRITAIGSNLASQKTGNVGFLGKI